MGAATGGPRSYVSLDVHWSCTISLIPTHLPNPEATAGPDCTRVRPARSNYYQLLDVRGHQLINLPRQLNAGSSMEVLARGQCLPDQASSSDQFLLDFSDSVDLGVHRYREFRVNITGYPIKIWLWRLIDHHEGGQRHCCRYTRQSRATRGG